MVYDLQMTAEEYEAALAKWGLRHKGAAKFFGYDDITSMRYATGKRKVPAPLAKLIRLMIALKLDPPKVNEWLEDRMSQWPEIPEENLIDAVVRWLGNRGHVVETAAGVPGLYHIDGGPELTINQVIGFYRQKIGLAP